MSDEKDNQKKLKKKQSIFSELCISFICNIVNGCVVSKSYANASVFSTLLTQSCKRPIIFKSKPSYNAVYELPNTITGAL